MNIEEVAKELGIAIVTAYEYARNNKIPAIKIGGIWRVSRAALKQMFLLETKKGDDQGTGTGSGNG